VGDSTPPHPPDQTSRSQLKPTIQNRENRIIVISDSFPAELQSGADWAERSGSGLDLRTALRTCFCARRKDISTLTASHGLVGTQGSAAGHAAGRADGISCKAVIAGQPAQSFREIIRKTEGLGGLCDRLPDAGRELHRSDVLGEVVKAGRQRPWTAQRHERGHAQAGGDANPFLLSQLDVYAVLHLAQVNRDRGSPARGVPARGSDLDDTLVSPADSLRFKVALIELSDKRIGEIGGAHRSMECFLLHGFVLHEGVPSGHFSCV